MGCTVVATNSSEFHCVNSVYRVPLNCTKTNLPLPNRHGIYFYYNRSGSNYPLCSYRCWQDRRIYRPPDGYSCCILKHRENENFRQPIFVSIVFTTEQSRTGSLSVCSLVWFVAAHMLLLNIPSNNYILQLVSTLGDRPVGQFLLQEKFCPSSTKSYFESWNLSELSFSLSVSFADVPLSTKEIGSTEITATSLLHSHNERFLIVGKQICCFLK